MGYVNKTIVNEFMWFFLVVVVVFILTPLDCASHPGFTTGFIQIV